MDNDNAQWLLKPEKQALSNWLIQGEQQADANWLIQRDQQPDANWLIQRQHQQPDNDKNPDLKDWLWIDDHNQKFPKVNVDEWLRQALLDHETADDDFDDVSIEVIE